MNIDFRMTNIDSFGGMDVRSQIESRCHQVHLQQLEGLDIEIHLKREDEIHPEVSGNKWRKLKYHLIYMLSEGIDTLVTYGGAYSNHIAASAAACKIYGLNSIGIIRGERVSPLNGTLSVAVENGMQLHFVDRSSYRNRKWELVEELVKVPRIHMVPEGGADNFGIKGCEEILSKKEVSFFDVVSCAAGTGTTAAGLLRSLQGQSHLHVYSALKGDFMRQQIEELAEQGSAHKNLHTTDKYSFGGYARTNRDLFDFITDFYNQTKVKLDPIYTGKMMYGLIEDVKEGLFQRGTKILAIHTGGLQGLAGIESRDKVSLFKD